MSLWRPNRYRASDTVAVCGEGSRRGVEHAHVGNGTERATVGHRARHSEVKLDGYCVVSVTTAGEDFRVPTGPGN